MNISNILLVGICMVGANISFKIICAEKRTISIPGIDMKMSGALDGYTHQEEPDSEHIQLWKEWLLIKDPNLPHIPFRDAAENVGQLRWLVEKRKKELSIQSIHK